MASERPDQDGDPRLTAYALGELDEAERVELSARLAESDGERRMVEETRRLGGLLRQTMRAHPAAVAASDLRPAVLQHLAEAAPAEVPLPRPRFPRRRYWLPISVAASLIAVSGTLYALMRTKHHEGVVAQSNFLVAGRGDPADEGAVLESIAPSTEQTTQDESNLIVSELEPDAVVVQDKVLEASPQSWFEFIGRKRHDQPLVKSKGGSFSDSDGHEQSDYSGRFLAGGKGLPDKGQVAGRQERGIPPAGRPANRFFSWGGPQGELGGTSPLASAQEKAENATQQRVAEGGSRARLQQELRLQEEKIKRLEQRMRNATMSADMFNRELAKKEAIEQALAGGQSQGMTGGMGVEARHVGGGISNSGSANIGDRYVAESGAEAYAPIVENPFLKVTDHPLSTFSIDVDTASYANVRRFLSSHALPPPAAVRIEEMINYFQYDYPQPEGPAPFSVTTEVARCPWNAEHKLLRVGLKGRDVAPERRPPSNLVFLLDVSGSMEAPNKLPLVKEAMQLLADKLTENDRVAIVVYAGNSGLVLPSTNGDNKEAIRSAIAGLIANGSTNGGQGLQMAYDVAQSRFIQGGTNRVILATDGDFNVGLTSQDELVRLVEEKAKSGVFLSALGFGVGNLKDSTLEKLADKGNGNYAYIDTLGEARKVLVEQLSGTLVTIAKDVKLQVEFNPAQVGQFRLIGYEDRILAHQDFNDDRKDAGDVGAGHTVTALYELLPRDQAATGIGPLKYQPSELPVPAIASDELATIKLRYKEPDSDESRLFEHIVAGQAKPDLAASGDLQFAAAVAAFGMLLRDSAYRGEATYEMVLELVQPGLARDANGYRSEFARLVRQAREIEPKRP